MRSTFLPTAVQIQHGKSNLVRESSPCYNDEEGLQTGWTLQNLHINHSVRATAITSLCDAVIQHARSWMWATKPGGRTTPAPFADITVDAVGQQVLIRLFQSPTYVSMAAIISSIFYGCVLLVCPPAVFSRPQACIIFLENMENHLRFGKKITYVNAFDWSIFCLLFE